jgi:hypothetical protein
MLWLERGMLTLQQQLKMARFALGVTCCCLLLQAAHSFPQQMQVQGVASLLMVQINVIIAKRLHTHSYTHQ